MLELPIQMSFLATGGFLPPSITVTKDCFSPRRTHLHNIWIGPITGFKLKRVILWMGIRARAGRLFDHCLPNQAHLHTLNRFHWFPMANLGERDAFYMFNRHLCVAYFYESFLPPTISMPFQVIFALLIISLLIKHCTMPPGIWSWFLEQKLSRSSYSLS